MHISIAVFARWQCSHDVAPRPRDTRIPRRPFLWLATALLFTVPPMVGALAPWVPALFITTLAAKFWMEPRGIRLRSAVLKVMLAVATLGAIAVSYGSLRGIEPGVSLLVVLMSLKVLEAHTAREFQVMVLVAWVLCLCGFIMSQDLANALALLTAFALISVALIQFHRGSARGALWPPLRIAGKLFAQALPLIVLLFLFFPRVSTGFRFPADGLRVGFRGLFRSTCRPAASPRSRVRPKSLFARNSRMAGCPRDRRCTGAAP